MRVATPHELGLHVKDRRKAKGWTQAELASVSGVSLRWLSDMERGKPTVEIGRVMRVLASLELVLLAVKATEARGEVDLNDVLRRLEMRND